MKGYFSQLAKQSGIRFSKRSEKTRNAAEFAPLHREETFPITPDLPDVKASKSGKGTFPKVSGETDKKSAPNQLPVPVNKPSESEKTKPQKINSDTELQSAKTWTSMLENADSADSQIIEQVVFHETEKPSAFEISEQEQPLSSAPEIESASSEKIENRTPPKEYFKKTSKLLETGTAEKSEIQQVLLQEIQEWTAGAPVSDEFENEWTETVEKTFEPETAVKLIELPTFERAAIDVRDSRGDNETERHEPAEQNFSLSIGTISIITEEAEKPAPPEVLQPKTRIENTTRETGRKFSRLSRHYL